MRTLCRELRPVNDKVESRNNRCRLRNSRAPPQHCPPPGLKLKSRVRVAQPPGGGVVWAVSEPAAAGVCTGVVELASEALGEASWLAPEPVEDAPCPAGSPPAATRPAASAAGPDSAVAACSEEVELAPWALVLGGAVPAAKPAAGR